VSRREKERLQDILAAIQAIDEHLAEGDLSLGIVFDAVRVRLIEIGEAVKGIDPEVLAKEPLPWADIAKNRDYLAHRYFDTSHAIVRGTVENDLPRLEAAVKRLLEDD